MKPDMRTALLITSFALAAASIALAQSPLTANTLRLDGPAEMPSASIDQFAWLAGHWQGDFMGGVADEVWAAPSGGAMLGMFRLVQDGEVSFYEIMTLVEEGGSVILKLKHFNADLTGWEEKEDFVSFPLVRLEPDAAYFDGLTFRRQSAEALEGYLAMEQGGNVSETAFTYRLVAAPAAATN